MVIIRIGKILDARRNYKIFSRSLQKYFRTDNYSLHILITN